MTLTQERRDELRRNSTRMMESCAVIAPYSISPDEVLSLLEENAALKDENDRLHAHLGLRIQMDEGRNDR